MFDKGYKFNLVDKKVNPAKDILCQWLYNFKTHRRRYLIIVEEYLNSIYIVKYHATCHTLCKEKFSFVFNDERPTYIIKTCIDVMLLHFAANPGASFGFVGSHSYNKLKKGTLVDKDKANSQRYRIYKTLMFNFFGKTTFAHSTDRKFSAYLMINRKNKEIKQFKREAQVAFEKIYISLTFGATPTPPPPSTISCG